MINIGINLPNDAVTQKIAFLGKTGSGKTYAATKLAEEFYSIGAQFVVVDPVGVWFGLRLAANGKDKGLSIPVFGGLHGDIPLEPTAGKLLADLIVDKGLSAILDISQFEHNSDKARFAEDFAARFFFKKKASPSAVHLFLEEAQELIPQNPGKGEERMLGVFERLWKLGRNFGIGGSIISQRPQEVNKKALNQTECIFAFQMTGTHERKAVQTWIEDKGIDEDISAILPKLEVGQARIWSPQWLKVSNNINILTKKTFNASSTPEVGRRAAVAKPLAPIELEKLKDEMKQTIEKAKSEDPKLLQRRIRELEALQNKHQAPVVDPRLQEELAHQKNKIRALEKNNTDLRNLYDNMCIKLRQIGMIVPDVFEEAPVPDLKTESFKKLPMSIPAKVNERIPMRTQSSKEYIPIGNIVLGRCERMIYTFLYHNSHKSFTASQVGAMTGYSHNSGGFNNALSKLRTMNLIKGTSSSLSVNEMTDEYLIDGTFEPSNIFNLLGRCEREIIKVLIDNPEIAFTKEDLAENTPSHYSAGSGGFNNSIARLSSLDLLERIDGKIKLHHKAAELYNL